MQGFSPVLPHSSLTPCCHDPRSRRPPRNGPRRPIIGILTLPNDVDTSLGHSYFPASYVKFIEGAGGRAVPIPYDQPLATTQALLKSLNGALFTGGSASFYNKNGSLTVFSKTANAVFQESVAAAAAGEVWPLWGTCLGHELISFLASNYSETVLTSGWDSENITLPIAWEAAAASSRLYGDVPEVRDIFASRAVALNAHQQGVSPASFAAAPALAGRFTVLGTSKDRAGKTFVAAMEGKAPLNIYTTQYHSEKIAVRGVGRALLLNRMSSVEALTSPPLPLYSPAVRVVGHRGHGPFLALIFCKPAL